MLLVRVAVLIPFRCGLENGRNGIGRFNKSSFIFTKVTLVQAACESRLHILFFERIAKKFCLNSQFARVYTRTIRCAREMRGYFAGDWNGGSAIRVHCWCAICVRECKKNLQQTAFLFARSEK